MRHIYAERANAALNCLFLLNIAIFALCSRPDLALRRTYRIRDGGVPSMLLSIFYHAELRHLVANLVPLHRYGTQLFVVASSRRWRSAVAVLLSYIACGVGAFWGVEAVSRYHQYQWEHRLRDARQASRCRHWLCDLLNEAWGTDVSALFTNAWADATTSLRFADVKVSMWHYQAIHRIGASGVVYGWMGMRVVTAWMSPYHSRLNGVDYFFLLSTLAHDLHESPLSLEDLRASSSLTADGVDHAAHVMGFACGMLWAATLILWENVATFGTGRWFRWGGGGGGRRLGTRWEEEQVMQEQSRQRRENSRLLNSSRSSGQQSSGRVML